jgi:hypothetical protein
MKIVFHWKRVWQLGTVHLRTGGATVAVPYRVTIRIRFDKETIDA